MKKSQPDPLASARELLRVELPLPAKLSQSLRAIAEDESNCDDLARLYPATENRAAPRDPTALRHLVACERCRRLYGALDAVFTAEPLPLPQSLHQRLLAIPRTVGPSLPWWLRDGRFAVAASVLLAVLLLLPIGDPETFLTRAASYTKTHVAAWTAQTEIESKETWSLFSQGVTSVYQQGKQSLELHGSSYTRLFSQTVKLFSSLKPFFENDPSIQGDSHGRTT